MEKVEEKKAEKRVEEEEKEKEEEEMEEQVALGLEGETSVNQDSQGDSFDLAPLQESLAAEGGEGHKKKVCTPEEIQARKEKEKERRKRKYANRKARRAAEKAETSGTGGATGVSEEGAQAGGKRKRVAGDTPPFVKQQQPPQKQGKTQQGHSAAVPGRLSYAQATQKSLSVRVSLAGQPSAPISKEQEGTIRKVLMELIHDRSSFGTTLPQFYGSGIQADGSFGVTCKDQDTKDWFLRMVSQRPELVADAPPPMHKISCWIPRKSWELAEILPQLQAQNPGLTNAVWRIIHAKEVPDPDPKAQSTSGQKAGTWVL